MSRERAPLSLNLPPAAQPAVDVVRRLRAAGHEALLAGGCVRDLLLGQVPEDYDVATSAPPDAVRRLFRPARLVGAQFGVVLVRVQGVWVEVATFRSDGVYRDGRRPESVTYSDARHDALRRDFTINGMFLDPLAGDTLDYVEGRADLAARRIRAIGEPRERFREDHLRLIRAVRFAARLEFEIEPATLEAIRATAPSLAGVAAERVREELEKMLTAPTRQRALRLLETCGLTGHLWSGAAWPAAAWTQADALLGRLPPGARFECAFAAMNLHRAAAEVDDVARRLAFSNEQRKHSAWLVAQQSALDNPAGPTLAELKRLMGHPAFESLRQLAEARYASRADGADLARRLAERLSSIAPERIAPPPLVTGEDLAARGLSPGPIYKRVLDELYTRQLEETLTTRREGLAALDALLLDRKRPQDD